MMIDIARGFFGLLVFVGIAYLFSNNRKAIDWRLVITGILLQFIVGLLVLKVSWVTFAFDQVSGGFVKFLNFASDGAAFLFSDLAKDSNSNNQVNHSLGFIVAFQVLPIIIFLSTISAALYYLGVLQRVVYALAWVMKKTMRLSGPESLATAGNIFLGQTEAPLLVKPFINKMTHSELMTLMTGGMATIAGSVLAAYVSFLGGGEEAERIIFASHLLSASIISAPAALVMGKMIIPETESSYEKLEVPKDKLGVNLLDAMATGASEGLRLALNVGAMLLAFIAIIAFLNYILKEFGMITHLNPIINDLTGGVFKSLSLEYLLGLVGYPIAWLMGIHYQDLLQVGSLIGQKTVVNEFVAYASLGEIKAAGQLSERSILIATYALCGFSNFSSIAIQIAGIGGLAPDRKDLQGILSKLGMRALLAASLACFMTATIAGIISG